MQIIAANAHSSPPLCCPIAAPTAETSMKGILILAAMLAAPSAANAQASKQEHVMKIQRSGSQPSQKGPADWFTGTVRIDPLNTAPAPARHGAASVTFEPGARTAWHTHPLGQTLIVTSG